MGLCSVALLPAPYPDVKEVSRKNQALYMEYISLFMYISQQKRLTNEHASAEQRRLCSLTKSWWQRRVKALTNFRSTKSMHLCRAKSSSSQPSVTGRLHLCWGRSRCRGRRRVTQRARRRGLCRVPRRLCRGSEGACKLD